MMEEIDQKMKEIFHEADVIDLDFSHWSQRIRLVVLATSFLDQDKYSIFNIDFIDVRHFKWESFHLDLPDNDKFLCNWTIYDSHIERRKSEIHIVLRNSHGPEPEISLLCSSMNIEKFNRSILDKFDPKWDQYYPPFLRGSLEDLITVIKSQKRLNGR